MTALSRKKDTYLAHTGNHERNMDNGEIDDNLVQIHKQAGPAETSSFADIAS